MNQELQLKLHRARINDRRNRQGRADFSVAEPVDNGPEGARPIEAPDARTIERLREGIAERKATLPVDRTPAGVLDVARRLRREHLSGDGQGYALVTAADLDLILAFVEERA